MMANTDFQQIIDKYYPAGTLRRDIYMRHCRSVADKALAIAERCRPRWAAEGIELADSDIEAAAMVHDIGICLCDAPSIDCHGTEPYLRHGALGADLLRSEGCPEAWARVAERHTGAGITADDIVRQGLPLIPGRNYMPETLLERLICYADKFYSKSGDMTEKPLPRVEASLAKFGEASLERFRALARLFNPC